MGSSFMKLPCVIEFYEFWDHAVFDGAERFKALYGVYPNIMQANQHTWDIIDDAANALGADGIMAESEESEPDETGIRRITAFHTEDFIIEFCLDPSIADESFLLIYDESPTFDGENADRSYVRIA